MNYTQFITRKFLQFIQGYKIIKFFQIFYPFTVSCVHVWHLNMFGFYHIIIKRKQIDKKSTLVLVFFCKAQLK